MFPQCLITSLYRGGNQRVQAGNPVSLSSAPIIITCWYYCAPGAPDTDQHSQCQRLPKEAYTIYVKRNKHHRERGRQENMTKEQVYKGEQVYEGHSIFKQSWSVFKIV